MQVGSLKQRASPQLVGFVFGCIIISIGLLYVLQKSVALGDSLVPSASVIGVVSE